MAGGEINRVTLIKVADEEDRKAVLEAYRIVLQTNKKASPAAAPREE